MNIRPLLEQFSSLPRFPDGRINYTGSDKALVLTCFVMYEDRILLLKRSDKVGSYRGKWNSVAGFVDEPVPIEDKILEELREELGISPDMIGGIKVGKPYEFHDAYIKKTWLIIPCLARLEREQEIKLDWEHTDYAWIDPERIGYYDTVANLEESLRIALDEVGPCEQGPTSAQEDGLSC